MSYKRSDSAYYWGGFIDPISGKRIRRSTGKTKKREANAVVRQWQVAAADSKRCELLPGSSLGQMIFLYMQSTENKPSGDRDAYSAPHLLGYFGRETLVDTIKPSDITKYQKDRLKSVCPGTVNKETGLFSVAFNFVKREEDWHLGINPCEGKRLAEPRTKVNFLSYEDAARMIAAVDETAPHTVDLVDLALQTGCRKKELLSLEWARVDFGNEEIVLREEDTKTSQPRTVPMNQAARRILVRRAGLRSELCPDTPWVFFHIRRTRNREIGDQITDVKRSIKTAAERAGLDGVTFHTLRHTCASWLAQHGVTSLTIRDVLGHASVKMTDRYMHSEKQSLHDAVATLGPVSQ